jgi:hypothetical protein
MKKWPVLAFLLIISLGLAGCPDDPPPPPPTTQTTTTPPPTTTPPTTTTPTTTPPVVKKRGIALPSKISVIPTKAKSAAPAKPGLLSKIRVLQAATDPGTDYNKAETLTYVAENDLEIASIIEDILFELAQTQYADEVGQGPYKALVSWEENIQGGSQKFIETWFVDSQLISRAGKEINQVQVWIEDPADEYGGPYLTKILFEIFAQANQNSDGSYRNYGVWTVNVSIKDHKKEKPENVSIDVGISGDGGAVIKIYADFSEKEEDTLINLGFRAALNQSDNVGFGKFAVKFETCTNTPPCTATTTETAYVYNEKHLAVKKMDAPTVFKDRNNVTEITEAYGVFVSDTGQNILKTKSFGFPVEFDMNGLQEGYYVVSQGRHHLWRDGGATSTPPTVKRLAIGNEVAEEFTVKEFTGVLTLVETGETVHPGNARQLIPDGTIFEQVGSPDGQIFQFVTDPNSSDFMGIFDGLGYPVEESMEGLVSTNTIAPIRANWEYPQDEYDHWASQQFLVKENGSYKILDDPIVFKPVTLTTEGGTTTTLSLEYDGSLRGLPELFFELSQNDFKMTKDIADKVINVPEGQELIDINNIKYLVKPLVIGQYLHALAADPGGLGMTQANNVDLSTVAAFPDNGMGAIPTGTVLKYTEGRR